jgi:hypothetical protein
MIEGNKYGERMEKEKDEKPEEERVERQGQDIFIVNRG